MTQNISSEPRNKNMFMLLKEVVNSFLDALNKPFLSEYGSYYDRIKTIAEGDSSVIADILLNRPDLDSSKLSHCLITSEKYLHSIVKDVSRTRPQASSKDEYRQELVFFLERMLRERDKMRERNTFSGVGLERHFDEFLKKEYLRYEAYLYNDSVSDFVIYPLENFVRIPTSIDFGDKLIIRYMTQDEYHSLAEAQEEYEGGLRSYSEIILCIPSNRDWVKDATTIISGLRLLKGGVIGLNKAYYGYAFPFKPWKIFEAPLESKLIKKPIGDSYTLNDYEIDELVRLFSLLEATKNIGYLSTALRRFNFGYGRDRLEDRWVDSFVSLESLFTKTGESTEVTHRIATRISKALAHKFEDRKEMYEKIKRWYMIRSRIVHGDSVSLKPNETQEVEEITRKSIKWFVNRKDYENHEAIIDELDLIT